MALLPYANRVTQQRGGRDRGSERGIRADGPPPRPSAPPPAVGDAPEVELDDDATLAEEVDA
jgi:hypothetical protein